MIQVLPFLNNPNDLDPSYKMDLDFGDCLEGKNSCPIAKEFKTPPICSCDSHAVPNKNECVVNE